MDVDGVEDNGTAREVFVDAGVEGTVRFGGLGEFFVPCDLREREGRRQKKRPNDIRTWLIERAVGKSAFIINARGNTRLKKG
jgi:hypothetical protein